MAMALARTTLLSSVFMSATVWRTVASKVASSITSTPALACPRTTRPMRPKMSPKNAIVFFSSFPFLDEALRCEAAEQTARAHHVDQQEVHTAQDIVLVIGAHIQNLGEVVERDGDV